MSILVEFGLDFSTPEESTSLARGGSPEISCAPNLLRPGGADIGSQTDQHRTTNDGPSGAIPGRAEWPPTTVGFRDGRRATRPVRSDFARPTGNGLPQPMRTMTAHWCWGISQPTDCDNSAILARATSLGKAARQLRPSTIGLTNN